MIVSKTVLNSAQQMSQAMMKEGVDQALWPPFLKVQLYVWKALLTSFLANEKLIWRLNMTFAQSQLSLMHNCLLHFFLHPDKIIDGWVRDLNFGLAVCQSKKIHLLLRIFNTGKVKNFFLRLLMHKKRPSYNETFYWYWVGCLHFLLSHGNISITHVKQSYNDNNWNLKVRWQVTGATILLIYEFKLLQYSLIIMGIITRRVFTSQINP